MNEEKKYYIYSINARWLELRKSDHDYVIWQIENAPENKFWDYTQFYKAFKEKPKENELYKIVREWWIKYQAKHPTYEFPIIIISFYEYESWWIEWFQHATFDIGQTNKEALDSFESFVRRQLNKDKPCLMGAEDRWRWCGFEPDGKPENRSKPPCRCKYCKEQGLIRIGH